MMRSMRASAKYIMGIVAVAFVGWMIFSVGMDVTGQGSSLPNTVAKVNGETIDVTTFYAAVRNEQNRIRAEQGVIPTSLEDQRALEDQVLESMIQNILLRQEFRRRGIRVSDQEVIEAAQSYPPPEIIDAPQFQTEGQFDLQKYQRFLASSTDPGFLLALEARYRDEIPRNKLFSQLTAGIYVSDAQLWRRYRDQYDSVTAVVLPLFPYLVVPDSEVTLTDEQVEAHYRAHRDDFTRPATAYLSFVALSRQPNASDSVAAIERAERLHAELVDGADFERMARQESADSVSAAEGGDLGEVALGRFVSEFETAALTLTPGETSDPVRTPFGYHIIRLESRTDTSFHARHILVTVELAGDHLDEVESKADTLDLYAAEQDDPGSLDQVADWLSLPVGQAPPVVEGGRLRLGSGFGIGDASIWAFGGDIDIGMTSPVIETETTYYVFRLDSLAPEGVPPFDQIRGTARIAATQAAKQTRTEEIAREVASDLASGMTLEEAAERHGVSTRTAAGFTRQSFPPVFQGAPEATGAAFAMGVGETSGPIHTDAGTFFVRPDAKIVADSSLFVSQLDLLRMQAIQLAGQQRVQLAMASLRRDADVQDLRRQLERAQRDAADNSLLPNALGF